MYTHILWGVVFLIPKQQWHETNDLNAGSQGSRHSWMGLVLKSQYGTVCSAPSGIRKSAERESVSRKIMALVFNFVHLTRYADDLLIDGPGTRNWQEIISDTPCEGTSSHESHPTAMLFLTRSFCVYNSGA